MKTRIFILLGGFMPGPDGWIDSAGMHVLAAELAAKFPAAEIAEFQWSSYPAAAEAIGKADAGDRIVVIGYSGGGSRATWLAKERPKLKIDLMVLYDPSPTWQMQPIKGTAVKRCLCYHNQNPFFLGLGGGAAIGDPGQVETIDVSENHMLVQADQGLHARTVKAIAALA